MQMMSILVDAPLSWKNVLNPITFISFEKQAYRFVEPAIPFDAPGGTLQNEFSEVSWAYYDISDGQYYLNISDNRLDWYEIFILTIKENEYRHYQIDFYTMTKVLVVFGSFLALMKTFFHFCFKGYVERDTQEFLVEKIMLEKDKNETEEDHKQKVADAKEKFQASRNIENQVNMFLEFQEIKTDIADKMIEIDTKVAADKYQKAMAQLIERIGDSERDMKDVTSKTDEKVAKTDEKVAKTDEKVAKTDERMKKLEEENLTLKKKLDKFD